MTTAAEAGGGPPPGLARLWAGWRTSYIERLNDGAEDLKPDGTGRSLFERILHSGGSDAETLIVWRGERCFVILNAYPYGSGHLLVLPNEAAPDLADLPADVSSELWQAVQDSVAAVRRAYDPDGVNVGINLGAGAGAGVPDHLHVHVMPRWRGDTNFITTIAETRVLPEPLEVTWSKVRDAWPAPPPNDASAPRAARS